MPTRFVLALIVFQCVSSAQLPSVQHSSTPLRLGAPAIVGVGSYTLICSGSADRTADLNTRLRALYEGGGGTLTVSGVCRVDGAILLPNNGADKSPVQRTMRITGNGGAANGYWFGGPGFGPSVLDLRYDAPVAKIDTRGSGLLEIDHLSLIDGGTDSAPFIQTTNTTLKVHDVAFAGAQGRDCGKATCNDGIILGGTGAVLTGGSGPDALFQGYGTNVRDNFFDAVGRAIVVRGDANATVIQSNTVSNTAGNQNGGAIEFIHSPFRSICGVVVMSNLIETTRYKYGIDMGSGACHNQLIANSCWDPILTSGCVHYQPGATGNLLIAGYNNGLPDYVDDNPIPSNTNISGDAITPTAFTQSVSFPTLALAGGTTPTKITCWREGRILGWATITAGVVSTCLP
jgi:hypothetical protein